MWFILAVAAAVLWGFDYAFSEQVFKHISVLSALAFTTIAAALVLSVIALLNGQLQRDFSVLASQPRVLFLLAVSAVAFICGDLLISTSITDKNATVSSLIEISYPFFVALFSYLFFAEGSLSLGTAAGGFLIFSGVGVIYFFNH